MITYQKVNSCRFAVLEDGMIIGYMNFVFSGWQFKPNDSPYGGKVHASLRLCQLALPHELLHFKESR